MRYWCFLNMDFSSSSSYIIYVGVETVSNWNRTTREDFGFVGQQIGRQVVCWLGCTVLTADGEMDSLRSC